MKQRLITQLKRRLRAETLAGRGARRLYRILRGRPNVSHYRERLRDRQNARHVHAGYARSLATPIKRQPKTTLAVVLHLYYVDMWPLFAERLKRLGETPFDLFITMPETADPNAQRQIKALYPAAHIFVVPNRGRDVLPFMQLAPLLSKAGYQSVLKMHTKKSPHRTDGNVWMTDLIDSLLPAEKTIQRVVHALNDPQTAVIGPEGQYLSLAVNFPANHPAIVALMSEIYTPALGQSIADHKEDYGFFAGTMFWARLDAIQKLIDLALPIVRYEAEKGQIDATLAHGIERVLCLCGEVDGKKLYEVGPRGLYQIKKYATDNIPDWSDVYIGPRGEE